MKLNVGVIFGGKSVEHEVSIITAIQAMNHIDTDKYEIIPIYITKDLQWYTGGCLRYVDTFKDFDLVKRYSKKVNLINKDGRYILQTNGFIKREVCELHLAFPIVHGANAEDGSIQGYLNLIGIPYVGSNVYSSATSQDKVFMKQILVANNIPVTKFVWFGERFYRNKKEELFKQIDELKYPLIIKPACLGSSVGIEMITRKEEIDSTIERSFQYDSKVVIEEKIQDLVEYNCSVLLTANGNITSEIEEVTTNKEIIEYGDKFLSDDSANDSSIKRTCPAEISDKLRKEIELTSLAVFKMLNMRGAARIDFLYDNKNKRLYVDEINSVPWCFSHHLWEARNISYKELLNIMLADAIAQEIKTQGMTTTLDSDVLNKINNAKLEEMK
ncbi:MAG: D-alanine--D-alanine ligase [Bacilli bacterium]|nr:D-alanine--D-alanine ligase [Bacilli bacterium]